MIVTFRYLLEKFLRLGEIKWLTGAQRGVMTYAYYYLRT